ncbi:3-phosphoshikimate 1-carboxyvinyltransferase [Listeria sp. PSOL-1]|uniref:3-phosphoshikimate 1-carboxyvinyltransferase n=1 Tax=Listeria sp. PSOL-1 TaxID=1844999 RepID=UPI0013D0DD49|nr:3-phosphoshikimate 1-carboxyvinyltransferase [Listeria sp. PSOL-1]
MKLITNKIALNGTIEVPGDKSISHRSIMFGALAKGKTTIRHFLLAEDCLSTIKAFRSLGVAIEVSEHEVTIDGASFSHLKAPKESLDVGNSGTTIRLMMGILAGQPFKVELFGDDSLAKRPMNRVMLPLRAMGAKLDGKNNSEFAPITVLGTTHLKPIEYTMPVASAQVKSALIFAALQASGETVIYEKEKTRDHTEQMIRQFGGKITTEGLTIKVEGGQTFIGQNVTVPGDISSAAFFLVAASIVPHCEIKLINVGLNPTRTGILDVLKEMGGDFTIHQGESDVSEPVGDIIIKTAKLKATTISGEMIPRLIDELPIIALLATQAEGTTIIKDAAELKVKETNRIDAVATELTKMGAVITPTEDGLIIHGKTALKAAKVTSYGDHRIGMMLQIAALLVQEGEVELEQADAVNVSYPAFFDDLKSLS